MHQVSPKKDDKQLKLDVRNVSAFYIFNNYLNVNAHKL